MLRSQELCLFDYVCSIFFACYMFGIDWKMWGYEATSQAVKHVLFWCFGKCTICKGVQETIAKIRIGHIYIILCIYIYYILYIYIGQKLLVSILGLRVELPSSLKATGRTQCLLVTQSSALVIVRSNFAGNSDWSLHCKIFRKPLSGMMEDMPKVPIFGLHVVYSIQHTNESWFSFSECLGAFALVQQNEHCQLKSCPLTHMSSSVIKIWGLLWFARRSE